MKLSSARAALLLAGCLLIGTMAIAGVWIGARDVDRRASERARERVLEELSRAVRGEVPPGSNGSEEGLVSVEVRRLSLDFVRSASGEERVALWRRAIETGRSELEVDERLGVVGAVVLPGKPPAGIVEASIPRASIARSRQVYVARVAPRMLAIALGLGLAVALLVRRYSAPFDRLREVAARLGDGDLETPVPSLAGDAGLPRLVGASGTSIAASLERMRRRLRDAASENERRRHELEAVLESAPVGVFAVDRDRRIRYISPRAAAALHVEPAEALGRFCGDLLRPEPVGGESPCDVACPILQSRFRGAVRAIERIRPLPSPAAVEGDALSVVISSSPEAGGLQVQVMREESADEAARRMRDAIVANLAHELKTPLAAQRAALELLRERLTASSADADTEDLAVGMEAGTARLERLIDNLLESIRIESGELGIRRQPVDLELVVEDAISTTAALFAKRGQRLSLDLPYPVPALLGDAPRLTQVLVNLLANAAKFAPQQSEVRLGATAVGDEIRLWVEDGGTGFAPADLPRLSSRFRRGRDAGGLAESGEEGSGLGLWIVRSIAERHGGSLSVERSGSEGNQRTRFMVRLPAAESPA